MGELLEKLKKAALAAGREGQKNPRLQKAALNIKLAIDAFKDGYRQQMEEGSTSGRILCRQCQSPLPERAKFCPRCGTKVE